MKKRWRFLYCFISLIVFILLATICIFGFFNSEVSAIVEKYNFESIYLNTDYDFVIPSPSFSQVSELETDDNGVKVLVPYYSFTTSLKVDSVDVQSNVLMFDNINKIEYTPYNEKRIVKGSIEKRNNVAIIDQYYANKNKCNISDSVSIKIGNNEYTFTIVGISENNTNYNDGSIALIVSQNDSKRINENNFKYGGAFVTASNYEKCKNYLNDTYKPLGRLKDRSDFKSDEAYLAHVSNFNNADWSKEITDMESNYKTLSVKYENVEKNNMVKNIIQCIVIFVFILFFNLLTIFLPSNHKMFAESLSKKKGTISDINKFYLKGNVFDFVFFELLLSVTMLIMVAVNGGMIIFNKITLFFCCPLIVIALNFVVCIILDKIAIKGIYSRKC